MANSIFRFCRRIVDQDGNEMKQTVTVFASTLPKARRVLEADLQTLQADSEVGEPALSLTPEWEVDQVPLDTPKVVTFSVTS